MPLDAIDPFDAFVLDVLLTGAPSESQEPQGQPEQASMAPFDAQAALAAFLAEIDVLDQDIRAVRNYHSSSTDLTATATKPVKGPSESLTNATDATGTTDTCSAFSTLPPTAAQAQLPACPLTQPLALPESTTACLDATSDNDALVKSAFSLFAQNHALAFALAPARPLKRKRRIRPKEELDTLRSTAEQLERDLKALGGTRKVAKRTHTAPVQATAIAITTARDRSKAVEVVALETNRQLRQSLEAQRALSTALSDALHTQQRDASEVRRCVEPTDRHSVSSASVDSC